MLLSGRVSKATGCKRPEDKKQGMIQDATSIHSEPVHAKVDTPRGDEAKTRRSKDGIWTKKGNNMAYLCE